MVQRIVLLKLKDESLGERERLAARTREVLAETAGVIRSEVGTPADPAAEKSWDLAFSIWLDSTDALPAYQAHAGHRHLVDHELAPHVECRKAWNFDVP